MIAARQQRTKKKGFKSLVFIVQVTLLGVLSAAQSSNASGENPSFACDGISNLEEYPSQLFVYRSPSAPFSSASLVSPQVGHAASALVHWLEVVYTEKGIQLHYRLPEVGLPLNVYNLRIEVLDRLGEPLLSDQLFEGEEDCSALSLFAGQKSRLFKVPAASNLESTDEFRVRVRILGTDL